MIVRSRSRLGKLVVVGCLVVAACCNTPLPGDRGDESARASLTGLPGVGVNVIVRSLETELEADGLRKQDIQTDVELKLRSLGIKVLTEAERLASVSKPMLVVGVGARPDGTGFYALSITVALKQRAVLASGDWATVLTWESSSVGTVGAKNARRFIRDVIIEDPLSKFANDFLAVNPK
jgi:hypothetical protein